MIRISFTSFDMFYHWVILLRFNGTFMYGEQLQPLRMITTLQLELQPHLLFISLSQSLSFSWEIEAKVSRKESNMSRYTQCLHLLFPLNPFPPVPNPHLSSTLPSPSPSRSWTSKTSTCVWWPVLVSLWPTLRLLNLTQYHVRLVQQLASNYLSQCGCASSRHVFHVHLELFKYSHT